MVALSREQPGLWKRHLLLLRLVPPAESEVWPHQAKSKCCSKHPDRDNNGIQTRPPLPVMEEWVFFISSDASCISIIFHNKKGKKHLKINKKKKKNNNNSPDNTPYSSDGCSRFGTPGSPVSVLLQAHSGSFIHSFIYSVFI